MEINYSALYIHWNINPEIFNFEGFSLRYYSVMFMLVFVCSYYFLEKIFKAENKNIELLNRLTFYVFAGTLAGARLGHCLFYEFDYYKFHPLQIILPFSIKGGNLNLPVTRGLPVMEEQSVYWLQCGYTAEGIK